MIIKRLGTVSGWALGLATSLPALGQLQYHFIATTGDPVPQTSATYATFSAPSINPSGKLAFIATLAGGGVTNANNTAVIAGQPGALALFARSGEPAPGADPGVVFGPISALDAPLFNSDGHVMFLSTLVGPGIDPLRPTFSYSIARPAGVQLVTLSSSSNVLFPNRTPVFTTADRAAWPTGGETHTYSPTAGVSEFGLNSIELPMMNPSGQIAVLRSVDGASPGGLGITTGTFTSLTTVVREGQLAPGTAPGTTFTLPLYPTINAAGQTAFYSWIDSDPPVQSMHTSSLWRSTPGPAPQSHTLQLIAKTGDLAPGTGGGRFGPFSIDIDVQDPPALSAAGEVAFTASFDGPSPGTGLFAGAPGNLRLVARKGQSAIGAPSGLTVVGDLDSTTHYYINARGQVAFTDFDRIGFEFPRTLYAADVDGTLYYIAREGQSFTLSDDESRIVKSIKFGDSGAHDGGGEDGNPTPFNDAGQLAFTLVFTDNTEATILTTVPEPGLGMTLLVLPLLVARSRRSVNASPVPNQ